MLLGKFMQYEVNTPDQYIKCLDDDWRKIVLNQIRTIILDHAPELEEHIKYKMLGYGLNDGSDNVFHLNAQKQHVGLYIGDISKIDPAGELTANLDVGKGCLRFKKSTKLDSAKLTEFITKTISMWRNNQDIGC